MFGREYNQQLILVWRLRQDVSKERAGCSKEEGVAANLFALIAHKNHLSPSLQLGETLEKCEGMVLPSFHSFFPHISRDLTTSHLQKATDCTRVQKLTKRPRGGAASCSSLCISSLS